MFSIMSSPRNTHYKVLNIKTTATFDDIKKAYKTQALKWHPDKHKHNKEEATEIFKKISEAYQVLHDVRLRSEYDSSLSNHSSTAVPQGTMSAEDLFQKEFKVLLEQVASQIHKQRGEGDRVLPSVGWGAVGLTVGYGLGILVFAPVAVPSALFFGVVGVVKGYTGDDVVTVYRNMDADTKMKVLEQLLEQLSK